MLKRHLLIEFINVFILFKKYLYSVYYVQGNYALGNKCLFHGSKHAANPLLESRAAAPSYFPESHPWSEISSFSKVILVWGKSQKSQGAKSRLWGCWVTWVMRCFTKNLCTRHAAWAGMLLSSPVAHSWGLLNHPNSFCRGMYKLNTKLDANSLLYSLSHFDATATQYKHSFNSIYHPHWLIQWRRHCSHIRIPVLSAWLPGYTDVTQTVLVILTMAGLFLDSLGIHDDLVTRNYLNQAKLQISYLETEDSKIRMRSKPDSGSKGWRGLFCKNG